MATPRRGAPSGRGAAADARRAARRRAARRKGQIRLAALVSVGVLAVVLAVVVPGASRPPGRTTRPPAHGRPVLTAAVPFPWHPGHRVVAGPNLAPGSDPSVLPGDVLIADEGNNRLLVVDPTGRIVWQFPRPGELPVGTTFLEPDDAFFTASGRQIIATEENDQVVSLVDVRTGRIVWRYGQPGVAGSGVGQLSNPDDAMVLPGNKVVIADIRNCSILVVPVGAHAPAQRFGLNETACYHDPPLRFGSPNGAFPLPDGNFLVTEINGDWASEMTTSGRILWSTHPPGVAYPSDTNEMAPGRYLTVDYSIPGQIVEFDRQGHLLWRYGPSSGPGELRTPSLCEPVPSNGDILCNDDGDDRVIVVDPRTDRIVWQYGHTGVAGSAPGYLSGPDGVDLAPPHSMLVRHAATLPRLPLTCATGLPLGACTVLDATSGTPATSGTAPAPGSSG